MDDHLRYISAIRHDFIYTSSYIALINQPVRMVSAMRLGDNAMSTFNNYIKSQPPIRILSAMSLDNEFTRAYTSSIKDFHLTKE
jgi:hypothetical protein